MNPLSIFFVIIISFIFGTTIFAQQDINDPRFPLALQLHKEGAFAASTTQFQLEMDRAKQEKDWETYFEVRNWISKNYWKQNLLDSAELFIENTLQEITSKLGAESLIESQTYSELGVVFDKKRNYEKALEVYKKCLAIRTEKLEKSAMELGQVYFNIGSCYNLQDRVKQSIEYYEKTRFIFEKNLAPNHLNMGWLYQNLGASNTKLNNYKEALDYWKKALNIFLENYGPNNPRVAIAYHDMASILVKKGFREELTAEELQLSTDWFDKSLSILKTLVPEEHSYIINIYIGKGALLFKMGRIEEGFSLLERAEQILLQKKGDKINDLMVCYANLAFGKLQQKDYQGALEEAHKGILVSCPNYTDTIVLNVPKIEGLSYNSPTKLLLLLSYKRRSFLRLYKQTKEKQYGDALKRCSAFEEMLCNKLSREFTHIGDQKSIAYRKLSNFYETAPYYFEEGDYKKLLHFSESSKSIFLKKALDLSSAKELGGIPDSLKNKELNLKKALAAQQAQILKVSKTGTDSLLTTLKAALLEDKHNLDDFITNLEQSYPQYYQLKYQNNTLSIAEIQEKILDEKTLLLEYFITSEAVYILGITKRTVKAKKIVDLKRFNNSVSVLKKTLSNLRYLSDNPKDAWNSYTQSAYDLYELLVADFVQDNKIKTLIVVPDQSLGRIPFETFLTTKVSGQDQKAYETLAYLLRDYAVYYTYSTSLLLNKIGQRTNSTGRVLGMAASYDPSRSVFETEDSEQLKLRKGLSDLPGAKREVKALEAIYEGDYFFGENANERNFKQIDFEKYSIVHLAMHGIMNKENPMLSSLAFTEKIDSLEDDFLYAYELTNLQISSDLMILSACETGDGSVRLTEGVMSLARSCLYAGASSILMTLWQVNDQSTSIIINSFYNKLSEGMSKSAALRAAKLEYIEFASDIVAHPNLWAALVSLGNDAPIVLNEKGGKMKYWYWATGILVFILIGLAVLKRKK